ncbi:TraR/DksA family transcriptional regulator [Candidatus Uhrbacteria bacterium]|nr:TraR/DksA family transcriptional regulator [Candidatus Uhrbacteria bacterium]
MNAESLEQIKAQLIEQKARLEQDLKDMGFHPGTKAPKTPDFPESGGNSDDDNASEVTTLADEISLGEKLEDELKDTAKAIKSIDDGSYGTCKYCGKPIDEKRLIARPTSSSCIECKKTLTQEA